MARVDFEVKPSSGVQAFWIAVGTQDVTLVNGKGSINLQPGKQLLLWWFVGNPGQSISITGKQGATTVVEVKESKVPDGEHEGAGTKRFSV
jgi:hypothetical protein